MGSLANTGVGVAFGDEFDAEEAFIDAGIDAAIGGVAGAFGGAGINKAVASYGARTLPQTLGRAGLDELIQPAFAAALRRSLYSGALREIGVGIAGNAVSTELGPNGYVRSGSLDPKGPVHYFANGGTPYGEVFGWDTPW